jgi:uncharacterized protein YdaL
MKKRYLSYLVLLFSLFVFSFTSFASNDKVIIYVEGDFDMKMQSTGEGRQLAALMGHFSIAPQVKGINAFNANEAKQYNTIFYVGIHNDFKIPADFKNFVLNNSTAKIIWINTGLNSVSNFDKKFGFKVIKYFKDSKYNLVRSDSKTFTKGTGEANIVQITDRSKVSVLATTSGKGQVEIPYILTSGKFTYIADSPFQNADETDRYLLLADLLHDFLGIQHNTEHYAMVRIEDVNPMSDPNKLRDVADILSAKGIPFMVGVVPFYVNPNEGVKLSLSDRPEIVDAIKYMVANGATIVMHGSTHQYRGITTDDFEFWDGSKQRAIPGMTPEDISLKLKDGIEEFMKNGLYPVLWETPHYCCSLMTYQVVKNFFSTAIEQRMSIENFEYGQSFPYVIQKDLYGQRILPEDLGYIPIESNNPKASWDAAKRMIRNVDYVKNVRDGYATFFFHPFVDLKILSEITDSIQKKGFKYVNVKAETNWVKLQDRVILTGSQKYTITLSNSYLSEIYFNEKGDIVKKIISKNRFVGNVTKDVQLQPGWTYVAEPAEYLYEKPSLKDKIFSKIKKIQKKYFSNNDWKMIRPSVLWNPSARGAAFQDQSSLVSVLRSLNIEADTIFIGEKLDLSHSNILVIPFAVVDSLNSDAVNQIAKFVNNGGSLILDHRSKLAENLGFKFGNVPVRVGLIRDKLYPQEYIAWKFRELSFKFGLEKKDVVYCEDPASNNPMVLGRQVGKGKILFINSMFDPYSTLGYSRYPFIMEHVRDFLNMRPFARRENLEVYFDPGLRPSSSVENLVKLWVKSGVRRVHVAGWHEYPKYTYDYARLLKLCHANGILVYAWLEPPQVNLKFYDAHPEWHEKNYLGKDAHPAWRNAVALTDPKCVAAIIEEYKKFFTKFNFDGVNLGEVYFESGNGFTEPEQFTPMHPSAIKELAEKYHIDAKNMFSPSSPSYWKTNSKVHNSVIEYRINKTKEVNEQFISFFTAYAQHKPGFHIILTTMDTYGSPELKENVGLDVDKILELQKKYKFALQIEDPQNRWSTDPARYIEMGKLYASKVSDPKLLMLDLNILNFRDKHEVTPFPTLIQTGVEAYQLIKCAAVGSQRFTIYAEGSVNPQDLSSLAYASASDVHYSNVTDQGFDVNSPYSFVLTLPKKVKALYIDNKPIVGYRENSYFVPAGKHTIKYADKEMLGFSSALIQPQVYSFTGNISDLNYGMKSMTFAYSSEESALISINREPVKVLIDGKPCAFEVMKGNDCFSIYLPAGDHNVDIETGSGFSYSVDITSLWSSSAIVFFGAIAVGLLIIMYFFMKIYRKIVA